MQVVLPEVDHEFQNQYFLSMVLHLVQKTNNYQYFIHHQIQGLLVVTDHMMYSME